MKEFLEHLYFIGTKLKKPAFLSGLIPLIAIPLFLYKQNKADLGDWDISAPYWFLLIQVILGLALGVRLLPSIFIWVKNHAPPPKYSILLILFTLVATFFIATHVEARHRVQSDEAVYLSMAQNMYHNQLAGSCFEGLFKDEGFECLRSNNSFKAKALPMLYLMGMPILGTDLNWIFNAHLFLYALTVLMVFMAVRVWTGSDFLSLTTAVFLMMQPTLLFQFRAMSVEPLYVFLSALSLVLLKFSRDTNRTEAWLLLALCLAFFAQTRQETLFCLFAFGFFSLPLLLKKPAPVFFTFNTLLALFTVPVLLTISHHQGYNFQGGEFRAHGIQNFFEHIITNWKVMAHTPMQDGLLWNPFLSNFTWFALLGLITLIILAFKSRTHLYQLLFLLFYHTQSYMIFENVSGDYTIEINQRYALVILPTMAFLTALFFEQIIFKVTPWVMGIKSYKPNPKTVFIISVLTVALGFGLTYRHKQSLKSNIMHKRNHLTTEQVAVHLWLDKQEDQKRLFIYGRPYHFTGYEMSGIHYDRFRGISDSQFKQYQTDFPGGIYYVRGLDCWDSKTYHKKAVEKRIPTTCDFLEKQFNLKAEYRVMITNNYPLTISKVTGFKTATPEHDIRILGISPIENSDNFSFRFFNGSNIPSEFKIRTLINNHIHKEKSPVQGFNAETLSIQQIQPAYNHFKLEIINSQNQIESSIEKELFVKTKNVISLTQLQPIYASQSWGNFKTNQSVGGNPLRINQIEYSEGIGTHAFSEIKYALNGQFKFFSTGMGIDDEDLGGDGAVFRIYGDGLKIYESPVLKGMEYQETKISVQNVQELLLLVDSLQSKDFDHADWVKPVLYQ
jgi:hypothetical protein